ncbi:proteinral transcription factor 3c polypeptide 4 [Elysia marginata]|uniref:Proteinral transcription factor 3c polypeptide 4 n=1 Tax=Elysia marginata TaxID=1093978 RepID=A0AAV4EHM4_9GAST|nr:proteinral transcription factor 3c polypeptide 4 [Elysia marginata]
MNSPFKKILSLLEEKHGEVFSRESLAWTPDDKLIVCCSEKLLIFNVLMNQHFESSETQNVFTTVVEDTFSIVNLPDVSLVDGMLNYESAFRHLKDVERQQIMSDPHLMDVGFIRFSQSKILKKAVCSSVIDSKREAVLIACLTFGARVIIILKAGHSFEPFECTELIKKKITSNISLPLCLKGKGDFEKYKTLMHSMSTVEIQWSHLFTIENSAPFSLLITGCRNGDVHIWSVGTELGSDKEGQFVWQFTDQYQSEVMSLAWLSKSSSRGLLAVGYVNGSIRCLDLRAAMNQTLSITVQEVMADLCCDNLSVAGMDFGKTSQGTEILVACKQYFLLLYTISDTTLKYCNHFGVDSVLPLSSVYLREMFGVASPQDSTVIAFEVQESSGEINIVQRIQEFEGLSENPNAAFFNCGATLSPSSALCFSVLKTEFNLQSHKRRKETGKQQVVMSIPFNLTIEKMMLNLRNPKISTKDTVLNLCLYIKSLAQTKEELADKMDQISDILELLQGMSGERGLQVALAVMEFLKLHIRSTSDPNLFVIDNPLTVKCAKNHKATLCCLSCQPCQDLNSRKCEACGALALSKNALSDSLLLQNKHICPLCGGRLRQLTWS